MKTSQKGIDLIIYYEGIEFNAYPDPATKNDPIKNGEPWTIGIGTTVYPNGEKVKKGDVITKEQAIKFLEYDIRIFENVINTNVSKYLNQNQFDALVSFVYNVGPGNFKKSTLLKKINKNPNDPQVGLEFNQWTRANKKVMPGLVKRRKSEADLYFELI